MTADRTASNVRYTCSYRQSWTRPLATSCAVHHLPNGEQYWRCMSGVQRSRIGEFVFSRVSEWVQFLQRVSQHSCKRCTSYRKSVWPSVWPSDRLSATVRYCVKTTQARIMGSSLEDSPMMLVSLCLTASRNSKGNLGSEAAEWERGGKSGQFLANNSPYLGNGGR